MLALLRRLAEERSLQTVVVTFDRHPASIVRPQSAPKLLCDLDQRLELIAQNGIGAALVLTFDEDLAAETAEDFVKKVLVGGLGTRVVVVGRDFHFGRDRGGNVELLSKLGDEYGFEVVGADLVDEAGRGSESSDRVSSTRIRALLTRGAVREAAALLGRPHEIRGIVVGGDRRGRELGFPTANIEVPREILVPADGVYACWYRRPDGTRHAAATSIGVRPTFSDSAGRRTVEAYLIDFSGDLYGETAALQFVERIRDEIRFDDVNSLVQQMRRDVERCRVLLAAAPEESSVEEVQRDVQLAPSSSDDH